MYCKQSSPLFLLVILAVALSLASCIHDPDWVKNQEKNKTRVVTSLILTLNDTVQTRGYQTNMSPVVTKFTPSIYLQEVAWTSQYTSDPGTPETTQLHVRKLTNHGAVYVLANCCRWYINDQPYESISWYDAAYLAATYPNYKDFVPAPCSAEELVELLLEQYPDYLIEISDTLEHDFNITLGFSNDSERPRLTLTE